MLQSMKEDKRNSQDCIQTQVLKGTHSESIITPAGKGEHRHYRETERPYRFKIVGKLVADFYDDIEKFKRGEEP